MRVIDQGERSSWDWVLYQLNRMKVDTDRRMSQFSTAVGKKLPKPSILSTEAKKSHSDLKQDSEDDSFKILKKSPTSNPFTTQK